MVRPGGHRATPAGERADPGDYLWPDDFNPMTALEYQARGKKWTAHGDRLPRRHHPDGQLVAEPDINTPGPPQARSRLRRFPARRPPPGRRRPRDQDRHHRGQEIMQMTQAMGKQQRTQALVQRLKL
ncbi:hypothetical protein [Streptomyces sp. NPDC056544]|uniref:hypothetical protein n=1 Tax=unclassified Streptomyces TaxID=2593676 RepID=UPI0036869CA8